MPGKIRLAIAAAIIAVASMCGLAYVGHEREATVASLTIAAPQSASVEFAPSGNIDARLLDQAFVRVQQSYYRPVNGQTLLDGERKALLSLLKDRHVAQPQVVALSVNGDRSHDLDVLTQTLRSTEKRYPKAATHVEYTQVAMRGMLNALGDPYTTYLSPQEINGLQEQLSGGDFGGIGVYIVQDPKTKQVVGAPIEGNPAYDAGMKPGDIIDRVDGTPTTGLKLDDVERLIRGQAGTTVSLAVLRGPQKQPHILHMKRAIIHVPSVKAEMLSDGIDYIRLYDFGTTSYDEVRKAILSGKAHNAKGYVLDLRNNGGGLLDAAVRISSLLIPSGDIVATIDRAGNRDARDTSDQYLDVKPLAILVNQYTASASEITAGAVQDHKAGTIVGVKTFGKGVVQSIYNLPDGGALKITTARYVTPNGRDIQHKGIVPDVVVKQSTDPVKAIDPRLFGTASDKQLATAKKIILENDK